VIVVMKTTTSSTKSLAAQALADMRKGTSGPLKSFSFLNEPVPASRPKVTRWGVYYGKRYTVWRKEAYPAAAAYDGTPTDKPVVVLVEAVMTKPKTGKLQTPRGDIDNYVKGPLDAMTAGKRFWKDDTQVVGLKAFKRYAEDGEVPGFFVHWIELEEFHDAS